MCEKVENKFDVLILTTPRDFLRVKKNYPRLMKYIPNNKLIFVGNTEVGKLVREQEWGTKVAFLNEDEIIPFQDVHTIVKDILGQEDVSRGITGWYYQQFLKMQYSFMCEDRYYLTWDGDTIPCRTLNMFQLDTNTPYLDLKHEYHEEYFITMHTLMPELYKCIGRSFISEHMLFRCDIMQGMIKDIMKNETVPGSTFYEKILRAIPSSNLIANSFSEFETYGTYVAIHYTNEYRLRSWNSFRYCGNFFDPDTITDQDYEWLGKDFDAVSFEKDCYVREDNREVFTKKEYREKLSARQILEIAQEEFLEGYKEVWD